MKAWTYYRDRAGDYVLVKDAALARDLHDAAAPAKPGKLRSVELTVVNDREIARYTKMAAADVPREWREALTGAL